MGNGSWKRHRVFNCRRSMVLSSEVKQSLLLSGRTRYSKMQKPEDYPKRRSDVNVRVVDGEVVILDRQAELIHQLNHTASYIWDRCDGHSTAAEIATQLVTAFDVDASTAIHDVATTVSQLYRLGLLKPANQIPDSR
jgi:hypothetical protein